MFISLRVGLQPDSDRLRVINKLLTVRKLVTYRNVGAPTGRGPLRLAGGLKGLPYTGLA